MLDNLGQIKIGNVTNKPTTIKFNRDSSAMDGAKGVAEAWMRWTGASGVSNSGIASCCRSTNIHTLRRTSVGKWEISFPSGTFSR